MKEPYLLLTYETNNSLAVSMKILSFLHNNRLSGEILHGSIDYIISRINKLLTKSINFNEKLGIIGHPSDWLISSDVNYNLVEEKYGIELINFPTSKLLKLYDSTAIKKDFQIFDHDFSQEESDKSKRMYLTLQQINKEYNLNGLTIRCFDLLSTAHTTRCLGLSLLNEKGNDSF